MMNNKSQVLMISLWLLAILTVLAVGIGHRVAMSLRISRYRQNTLKASYLAKAAVNLAITEIEKAASSGSSSMKDQWANNEDLFKYITLSNNPREYAEVSYAPGEDFGGRDKIYGAMDEERRININTASRYVLLELFSQCGTNAPEGLADNILIWRGDAQDINKAYESLGYSPKGEDLVTIEELALVKDMPDDDFDKIKESITVYGKSVNINTASDNVLQTILRSQVNFLNDNGVDDVTLTDADNLKQKIINKRNGPDAALGTQDDSPFSNTSEIANSLELNDKERQLLDQSIQDGLIGTQSRFIRIQAKGYANNRLSSMSIVYDRSSRKIISWHEN